MPPDDAGAEVAPLEATVGRLREAIDTADGVLIATHEYNGSIPCAPRNALDWASRPFPDNLLRGKPVAVVVASTGLFGAIWALAETRKVLGVIGAQVVEQELPVGQAESAFGDNRQMTDPQLHEALRNRLEAVIALAGAEARRAA